MDCLNFLNTDRILLIGVGGGYDIFTCLPWYLSLTDSEKDCCVLANYSFSDDLSSYDYSNLGFVAIDSKSIKPTQKNQNYFPELHLSQSINKIVYAIRLFPCPQLFDVLRKLISVEKITKVYAFDGGVDSIILKPSSVDQLYGSPLEDSQMVIALNQVCGELSISCKLITSALSIDDCDINLYHENWKTMEQSNATFGKFEIGPSFCNSGWSVYESIVDTCNPPSIIQECLVQAGNGKLGVFVNPRLYPSRIDDPSDFPNIINDTKMFWIWDLKELVKISDFYQFLLRSLYSVHSTESMINEDWIFWNRLINGFLYST